VSDRTGSGLVELAVLETVDATTAGRPRAHVVCTEAVAAIEERIGLGPRYGYEVLLDLARPWIIPVPTVRVAGNKGDRSFPEASAPRHTECRPSHVGQLVLEAEGRRRAPVPVGIINGTTYRGGVQPPLEPSRVLAALRRLLDDPGVLDSDVLGIVGPPYSTAGCELTGDLDALMQGAPAVVRETAKITITGVPVPPAPAEPPPPVRPRAGVTHHFARAMTGLPPLRHPAHLVIESLPARISISQAGEAITGDAELPLENITDRSGENDVRIMIALRPGSDPVAVRDQLAAIDGITTEATWKFPAPLASMLRSWVDRYRGEDIAESLVSLEYAIRRDRQRRDRTPAPRMLAERHEPDTHGGTGPMA
jgi:hypothetical protein